MTPERFREIQDATGFSSRFLGNLFREDDRKIRRWGAGKEEIPHPIAVWMEEAMAAMKPLFARAPSMHPKRQEFPAPSRHVQRPL